MALVCYEPPEGRFSLLSTTSPHETDNRLGNLVILSEIEHERLHRNGSKNLKHRTCTENGCEKRHQARGLCNMHYMRLLRESHAG